MKRSALTEKLSRDGQLYFNFGDEFYIMFRRDGYLESTCRTEIACLARLRTRLTSLLPEDNPADMPF